MCLSIVCISLLHLNLVLGQLHRYAIVSFRRRGGRLRLYSFNYHLSKTHCHCHTAKLQLELLHLLTDAYLKISLGLGMIVIHLGVELLLGKYRDLLIGEQSTHVDFEGNFIRYFLYQYCLG